MEYTEATCEDILKLQPSDRSLVIAPPGTGKTYTAIQLINHLVDQENLAGSRILILSFTRTAVAELKKRLRGLGLPKAKVNSLHVSTLDSRAWSMQFVEDPDGLEDQSKTSKGFQSSFEANIKELNEKIAEGEEGIIGQILSYRYVIVDEAQDLVGSRYELVKKILQNAHETCGWIVLGDPLQAIYEFTGQDEDEPEEVENATDSMHGVALYRMENLGHYTHHMRFTKDHRSKTPEQRELMEEAREATEEGEMSDLIREKLTAAKEYGISELHKTFQSDDDLLLFRTRGEVLAASSYFLQNQKRHRIRLSGVGDHVESWIGSVFQHFDHPVPDTVRKSLFLDAYARAFPDCATGSSRWDQLLELAKKTEQADRLDVRKLKQLISKPRPPVELSMLDGGSEGPTLGTIHASKGRESENVVTFFPSKFDSSDSAEDPEEEERILYVATTRARSQFSAAQMDTNKNTKSVQGRCYKSISPKKYQRKIIEVGRSGDSNPLMMAAFIATRAHLESSDVHKALNDWQERLNKLLADDQFPVAMSGGLNQPLLPETKRDYVFEVQAERKKGSSVLRQKDPLSSCFGCISLGRDVFLNGNAQSAVSLNFPYITGVGTYALPREPDDKQRGLIEQLDGWEETVSRIWLYPIFRGFCLYNHR